MIDMRYHVISLVAVFLALGIGILLGTTLVERGLIAEQKSEIASLKRTFQEIKEKNRSLNDRLNAYARYAEETAPRMVTGILEGRSYAVVATDTPDDGTLGKISQGLAAAGGAAPLTITISPSENFEDQATVANLATLFQAPPAADRLKERVFAEVVNQLATASNTGILKTLQQLGVIRVHGTLEEPMSAAVLLAPVEAGKLSKTDVPLVKAFVASAYPAVGVTDSSTESAVLSLYKKNGISTVDNVDTVPGQVALAMTLSGKTGNWGSGSEASRMLPPL